MQRHSALQPLSRQHHQLLLAALLCQKGAQRQTPVATLQRFAAQTWLQIGQPYYRQMQQFVLPALQQHYQLGAYAHTVGHMLAHTQATWQTYAQWHKAADSAALPKAIRQLVRFLERELFENWQTQFSPNCLNLLQHLQEPTADCLHFSPAFWA